MAERRLEGTAEAVVAVLFQDVVHEGVVESGGHVSTLCGVRINLTDAFVRVKDPATCMTCIATPEGVWERRFTYRGPTAYEYAFPDSLIKTVESVDTE